MQTSTDKIIYLLLITTVILLLLVSVIVILLSAYQKRQISYQQSLDAMRLNFDKNLLSTQLEVQEQTFQHISREIHDNINLSLVLVKLKLNQIQWDNLENIKDTIKSSIDTLTTTINDLSNLSKSTSTELIKQLGLLKAIQHEIARIKTLSNVNVSSELKGEPIFLNGEKELIAFRIIQEAFNNIIKHSFADKVNLKMHYESNCLVITIEDNGVGFDKTMVMSSIRKSSAGLKNMSTRAKSFGGELRINSKLHKGTTIEFKLPYTYEQQN
jgi:two-component system, NarL family, sensor kinase